MRNEERKIWLREICVWFGGYREVFFVGDVMKKKDWEAVYLARVKKERGLLKEFVAKCKEDADNLLYVYRHDRTAIPDDEYRAVAFFLNDEYADKPRALSSLYDISERLSAELPPVTRETVLDHLKFRFMVFNKILQEGAFNG